MPSNGVSKWPSLCPYSISRSRLSCSRCPWVRYELDAWAGRRLVSEVKFVSHCVQEVMLSEHQPSRRSVLKAVGGVTAAVTLGGGAIVATASTASAAEDGFGLGIVDSNEADPRMWYYRFSTDAVDWDPAVNVLLPEDYHTSGATYPVVYLFHGGGTGQDYAAWDRAGIRELAAGKPVIIVMPDGGPAGWYCDPVSSNTGPRNWEIFHIHQLRPWIEANFRTFAEVSGRAVSGFSMGGFGAMKYAAKYPDLFGSASAHSGPPSLRRDGGLVVHWANASSAAVELGGGMVYGSPWDEARVTADNPVEQLENFRGKRIFMVAGTSPDPVNWFDTVNETQVLAGQQEFRSLLDGANIAHESYEEPGGHVIRGHLVSRDLDGIVGRLRKA